MFIKLSNSYDDRKLFREPASTCQLAASGFCEERKSAFIPSSTTAVCENWNVSDKYTWDDTGNLKQLSMDQTLSDFHMVMYVFDNSNLSQEIFAVDT